MSSANQELAARAELRRIYRAAIAAVDPARLVRERLTIDGDALNIRLGERRNLRVAAERVWLVAAGKAAPAMAKAAVSVLGVRLAGGVVAAPVGAPKLRRVRAFVGGHPLPTRRSVAAGRAAWRLAGSARRGDLVVLLLSGGASSLLALPAPGISLADKIRTSQLLLGVRASIGEVNAVRKHLSRLKGGGLVRRANRARVIALSLSDVIGGAPSVIGSGPAAADPATFADAWRILERHGLLEHVPARVRNRLARGRRGRIAETLKPGERRTLNVVIGDYRLALAAAAECARRLGFRVRILARPLYGDTRVAARGFARNLRRPPGRGRRPLCVIAGGETTVEVRGGGKGGRNQEFALALAGEIAGLPGIHCLSAGSDGRDGPTDAAGAFVDGRTMEHAARRRLDPQAFLDRNDSYEFFRRLGGLFKPGPTGTNVMDLKIAIVG